MVNKAFKKVSINLTTPKGHDSISKISLNYIITSVLYLYLQFGFVETANKPHRNTSSYCYQFIVCASVDVLKHVWAKYINESHLIEDNTVCILFKTKAKYGYKPYYTSLAWFSIEHIVKANVDIVDYYPVLSPCT